jgi:hypothetical protein
MEHKRESSAPLVMRFEFVLMIIGFVVAVLLAGLGYYLNPQIPTHREALLILSRFFVWIWPFGIMMMVDTSNTFIAVLILLVSAIFNAGLYGLIGVAIASVWQRLRKRASHNKK